MVEVPREGGVAGSEGMVEGGEGREEGERGREGSSRRGGEEMVGKGREGS